MFEVRLLCPEDRVEPLGEAFEALDALSVSVEDAAAQTEAEQALFGEPGMPPPKEGWQRSRMVALFAQQAQADEAAALLPLQDFFEGCECLGVRPVQAQDWVRLTQAQFEPQKISERLWIVPTWHDTPEAAREVIRLDPGLRPGLTFMTLHNPDTVPVNLLTIDATDPKSGTAEFKATAIRIEKLAAAVR